MSVQRQLQKNYINQKWKLLSGLKSGIFDQRLIVENRDIVDRIDNQGTAAILLNVEEEAGNSTTRLLPEGQKEQNKKGCISATL